MASHLLRSSRGSGRPSPPSRFRSQPAGLPRQHERARHAEEVARHQQRQHHQPAVVQPRADRRQVLRRKLRPDEPVEDHQAASRKIGICMAVRAWRHLRNGPISGQVSRSRRGERGVGGHAHDVPKGRGDGRVVFGASGASAFPGSCGLNSGFLIMRRNPPLLGYGAST